MKWLFANNRDVRPFHLYEVPSSAVDVDRIILDANNVTRLADEKHGAV